MEQGLFSDARLGILLLFMDTTVLLFELRFREVKHSLSWFFLLCVYLALPCSRLPGVFCFELCSALSGIQKTFHCYFSFKEPLTIAGKRKKCTCIFRE